MAFEFQKRSPWRGSETGWFYTNPISSSTWHTAKCYFPASFAVECGPGICVEVICSLPIQIPIQLWCIKENKHLSHGIIMNYPSLPLLADWNERTCWVITKRHILDTGESTKVKILGPWIIVWRGVAVQRIRNTGFKLSCEEICFYCVKTVRVEVLCHTLS